MVLLGSFINAALIVVGSIIGSVFKNIPEKMKNTVLSIIGLAVAVLGIKMGLETSNFVIVVLSLVIGAVIGEWLDLDTLLNKFGAWVEAIINRNKKTQSSIAEGFVTSTLIFLVGSMGILGALDSGLRNDHSLQITKGILDGFISIVLTSTLGIGVLLSAIPIFIYQGLISVCAEYISSYVPEAVLNMFIQEMTATGGIMIVAIGLNIAGLTKIRVANLLPGIVVVGIIVAILFPFQ